MKSILLISDTHSYLGKDMLPYIEAADEIWHAGDIGSVEVVEYLELTRKTLRIVYGNIDSTDVRIRTFEEAIFKCEGLNVYMIHIGGYPKRYRKNIKEKLQLYKPDLYICGHSHILKVMRDKNLNLLHFNPGACGAHGINEFRTMLTFDIHEGNISNLKAIELGLRSGLKHTNNIFIK